MTNEIEGFIGALCVRLPKTITVGQIWVSFDPDVIPIQAKVSWRFRNLSLVRRVSEQEMIRAIGSPSRLEDVLNLIGWEIQSYLRSNHKELDHPWSIHEPLY